MTNAFRSSLVPPPGWLGSRDGGPHFLLSFRLRSNVFFVRTGILSLMGSRGSLPSTVDARPCRFVQDLPQSPDSVRPRSLPSVGDVAFRLLRAELLRDEDRDGCLLGIGDGSLDTYGVS